MLNRSGSLSKLHNNKRISLAFLWAFMTLFSCYFVLFAGVLILGEKGSQDFVVISLYTLIPAIMAIIFLFYFKTGNITTQPFQYPGFHWVAFGVYYTAIVLALTIVSGFIIGEFTPNSDYTPFPEGSYTSIPLLDILIFLPLYGTLLIFSPGGFPRVLGEEYGWRGYFLPELLKTRLSLSIFVSLWIVGGVWFIYHIPFFTIFAPNQEIDKMIFLLVGSAGVFFGANLAMSWAYLKTKNLWPALSLHYVWNLTSPLFTGNIYSETNRLGYLNKSVDSLWLVNGEGLIGGLFHFLVGLIFLYLIYRNKNDLLEAYHQKELLEDIALTTSPNNIQDNMVSKKKRRRKRRYSSKKISKK
ncbi:MAG: CPBP family glutamic-type intramembrane protease [Candidatus Hodarchaeales archaeon]